MKPEIIVYLCNMEVQERFNEIKEIKFPYRTEYFYNYHNSIIKDIDFLDLIKPNFHHHIYNNGGLIGSYCCAVGHYSIVRSCYDRGFNNALILEDDVSPDKIEYLEQIPDDADLVKFLTSGRNPLPNVSDLTRSEPYVRSTVHTSSRQAYMFSRKAMEKFIGYMSDKLTYSDMFSWDYRGIDTGDLIQYIATKRVFYDRRLKSTIGYANIVR